MMKQIWLDELRAIEKSRNQYGSVGLDNWLRIRDISRMLQLVFKMGIGQIERYAKIK